jgi:kynureninase
MKLELHDWDADFASWCSYKYMNSGPEMLLGVFIHEKQPRLTKICWLVGNKERRLKWNKLLTLLREQRVGKISNIPILSLAPWQLCGYV